MQNKPKQIKSSLEEKIEILFENIKKVFKGKKEAIRVAILTLISKGHLLIEDIPGVGKTTLAKSIARSFDLAFARIQFNSDTLPSDIIGVSIYDENKKEFVYKKGPVFTNILLADEINRANPRTQSGLLEAMNEHQVSVDGNIYILPEPFMIIATQNPFESHGTYPLPHSQLDRFMTRLELGYPEREKEIEIIKEDPNTSKISPVISKKELLDLQRKREDIYVSYKILEYIERICEASRRHKDVYLGLSPRGALFLKKLAQANALLSARDYVTPDDIKYVAPYVMSHRIIFKRSKDAFSKEASVLEIISDAKVPI